MFRAPTFSADRFDKPQPASELTRYKAAPPKGRLVLFHASHARLHFPTIGITIGVTAGLHTATAIGEDHWTAELAIPWQSLGLDGPSENARLLLARNRHTTGRGEIFQFPVSPSGNHQPGMFATLRLSE